MSTWLKTSMMTLALASVVGLTACQSNTAPHNDRPDHLPKSAHNDKQRPPLPHSGKPFDKMTDQEKAAFQQRMQEHQAKREALDKACEGKVGQTISVKVGDKTLEGKCEVNFKPNRPEKGQQPPLPPQDGQLAPQPPAPNQAAVNS
ncbi:hypothetical protein F4V57_12070 [Acinetobacter qingfengensis]|uniref:Uncharacterized protein n=1 Tax=Acinetobacter qingfengensis TaxID=1262585 RepID=A0A1E7QXM5_9GAMM|nr:hypothetical protein [Acinetobacter qingfengensis]KAA8731653.1 hypothetical protein F4V57_12070 [Acinetobacter qingfengensis]OEY91756.1 hypothetical protein BJI46_06325 [Acinetobacter qingfengensis]